LRTWPRMGHACSSGPSGASSSRLGFESSQRSPRRESGQLQRPFTHFPCSPQPIPHDGSSPVQASAEVKFPEMASANACVPSGTFRASMIRAYRPGAAASSTTFSTLFALSRTACHPLELSRAWRPLPKPRWMPELSSRSSRSRSFTSVCAWKSSVPLD
jgi:hypothetical protein